MLWTPREPQTLMRDFIIANKRCNIWADMGTGKSSATLTALDILWLAGSQYWPVLVIAPKRVARDTWGDESHKWDHLKHLRVSKILGTPKEREAAVRREADVYTINYENVPWLVDLLGKRGWKFKIIIADESRKLSGFRITHGGIRAAALSRVAKMTGRWVNLTGTPAPEGLVDLWGPNWFVDFGATLGRTHTAFSERWFRKTDFGLEPFAHSRKQIMELIAPFTISLEGKDYYEGYMEPLERPVYFDLPPAARKIYNDMELDMFASLTPDIDVEAMNSGSKYGKCSQIASGAIYTDDEKNWELVHDCKITALKEVVDELCGEPLIVAYHFKHDLERLRKAFPHARVYESKQDQDDWNAGKVQMMLAHPQSAGHGLNWQGGGFNIAIFSAIPSLELRMQIIERIGWVRQMQSGHPRQPNVWDLIARDTVNEVDFVRATNKASYQSTLRAYHTRKTNRSLQDTALNDAWQIAFGESR